MPVQTGLTLGAVFDYEYVVRREFILERDAASLANARLLVVMFVPFSIDVLGLPSWERNHTMVKRM